MSDKLQFVVVNHVAGLPAEGNDKLKFIGHQILSRKLTRTADLKSIAKRVYLPKMLLLDRCLSAQLCGSIFHSYLSLYSPDVINAFTISAARKSPPNWFSFANQKS